MEDNQNKKVEGDSTENPQQEQKEATNNANNNNSNTSNAINQELVLSEIKKYIDLKFTELSKTIPQKEQEPNNEELEEW